MHYEKKHYSIDTEAQPHCRLDVKIHISPEQSTTFYKKALKEINKEVSLPGFRKGKAPDEVIIKRYGSNLDQEWKEIMINESFQEALELLPFRPLHEKAVDKVKLEKASKEEGSAIFYSFEYYPELPSFNFKELSLSPFIPPTISDQEVEDVLTDIQEQQSTFENVERGCELGDFVELSIDALEEEGEKQIAKQRRFKMEKIGHWLQKMLLGKQAGAVLEGTSELDEKAPEEVKKGFKPTRVRVTLHAVQQALLPPIDEEMAKKTGAPSLEALKVRIREDLLKEATDAEREHKFAEVMEALLAKFSFEVPLSIIHRERENVLMRRKAHLMKQGVAEEQVEPLLKEREKEMDAEAEKNIRIYFINRKMIRDGKLEVTHDELNLKLLNQFFKNKTKEEMQEYVDRLSSRLMHLKVIDYALSQL